MEYTDIAPVAELAPAVTPAVAPAPTHNAPQAATAYQAPLVGRASARMLPEAPVLGNYTDFRLYLHDVFEHRRLTESTGFRSYSYTAFSAAADIKSPNYLKLIIEGRRNLSDDMVGKFARALRLQKSEIEEFRVLVHYGQATEPIKRNQFLKELADLRARRAFQSGDINQQAWDKVPSWMGWVIYAMTDQAGVSFDPEELYRLFRAKTSPDDIKTQLKRLVESGNLKERVSAENAAATEIVKGRDLIDSPQDLPVELIRKLQAELIYLGIESLFRDSPKDREFGAMTIAMTQQEFEQVRFEIRQMRKRIQKDLMVKRETTKGDRVYQMNFQLFPVTDRAEGGRA